MPGSTISRLVTNTVTLGSSAYPSPLTVTSTGSIAVPASGAYGVFAPLSSPGVSLINHGRITGGGTGVYFGSLGIITNTGTIAGGSLGGGVYLERGGNISNSGTIAGGNAPADTPFFGGNGVSSAYFGVQTVTLTNTGVIIGGAAGALNYGGPGGNGGSGADISYGAITNIGTIFGGAGGAGNSESGSGGNGVSIRYSSATNAGTIWGGTGGSYGGYDGGTGGAGAYVVLGTVSTSGTVSGGAGGYGAQGGLGGAGVFISAGTVVNAGKIAGGIGGTGNGVGNGGAGAYLYGGTLITSGTLSGGAGGTNSSGNIGLAGDAVQFSNLQGGRLVVEPGAVFNGAVVANVSVNDVLELAGATLASLTGLGTQFTGFTTIAVDSGARWALIGGNVLAQGTTLEVGGALTLRDVLVDNSPTGVTAGGVLLAANGSVGLLAGVTLSGGSLMAAANAKLVVGSTLAGTQNGRLTVEAGVSIAGFGKIGMAGSATVLDQGRIVAKGGTLELARSVSGGGSLTISSGATLVADQALSASGVVFAPGPGGTLVLNDPRAATSTMSGFGAGDLIDMRTVVAKTANFVRGTLQLLDQHHVVIDQIKFAGSYTTANFALSSDGHGGTDIRFVAAAMASAAQDLAAPVQIDYASEKTATPVGWMGNGYAAALDPLAAAETTQGWHAANHVRS